MRVRVCVLMLLFGLTACGAAKKEAEPTPDALTVKTFEAPPAYACDPNGSTSAPATFRYVVPNANAVAFLVDGQPAAEEANAKPPVVLPSTAGADNTPSGGSTNLGLPCDGRKHEIVVTWSIVAPSGKVETSVVRSVDLEQTSASPAPSRKPQAVDAAEAANGKTVELFTGDELRITLEENQSTGYHWEYSYYWDTNVIRKAYDNVVGPPASSPPGAGGHHVFRLEAVGPGETTIRLSYAPPGGGDPGRRYLITVRVS